MKLFYMLYNCLTTTRIYTSIYFQLMLLFFSYFSHTAFHALWLSHSHLLWYPAYFFFNYILYISLYFISFHEIYLLFSGNIHNWCISLSFSIKCIYIHIYIYLFFSRSHLLLHTHQHSVYFPYSVSFPFIQLHISVFLLCTAHKVAPHHFYTWALPHLPIFPSRSTAIPISFPLMLSYVVEFSVFVLLTATIPRILRAYSRTCSLRSWDPTIRIGSPYSVEEKNFYHSVSTCSSRPPTPRSPLHVSSLSVFQVIAADSSSYDFLFIKRKDLEMRISYIFQKNANYFLDFSLF